MLWLIKKKVLTEYMNGSQVSTNSVRSAPQEVNPTNLTNLPVLESLSPRSQDEPESRNTNPQPSVVGTLLDNDLRFFKAFSLY